MGNAQQLRGHADHGDASGRHRRALLFAVGVLSLTLLSVTGSLAAWIAIPALALRWAPTVVVSGSMHPAVEVGDVVVLRPVGRTPPGVATVVLYEGDVPTGRTLHRVVGRTTDGSYLTKGDANAGNDTAPVRPGQLRGVAVLLVPWIGRPSVWALHREVMALAACAIALVACLRLAVFAFDPAYDPWAGRSQVLPVAVLSRASAGRGVPLRAERLLPVAQWDSARNGWAAYTASARTRADDLRARRAELVEVAS